MGWYTVTAWQPKCLPYDGAAMQHCAQTLTRQLGAHIESLWDACYRAAGLPQQGQPSISAPCCRFEEWGPRVRELLDPQKETVVLCHHGVRSMQMCQYLIGVQSMGFHRRRRCPQRSCV